MCETPATARPFVANRRAIMLVCALSLLGIGGVVRGQDFDDIPTDALEKFQFEGLKFSTAPGELKKKFPAMERDADKSDAKLSVQCYRVTHLKTADVARLYYVDDMLYQVEIDYQPNRIEAQGGADAMIKKLVTAWGPAGHVDAMRRTWQEPTCGRRADFYPGADGARLFVTDTNLTAIVGERAKRLGK
jgi:hypothetical protein